MNENLHDVLVVGAGISGLTAAWRLKQGGVDVYLLEACKEVGGCARTGQRDGFLLEKGPFNVVVRDPAFEQLLDDLSGDVKVVTASRSAKRRFIYRRGCLHPLPTNPVSLATTRLLSFRGRCRLLAGILISPSAGRGEETIDQAATRRFGQEASSILVSAAVSGIFAGDFRRLSLQACFPSVWDMDARIRSPLAFLLRSRFATIRKKLRVRQPRWRGLISVDGGLGALTAALGRRLGSVLIGDCRAERIHQSDEGYEVTCRSPGGIPRTFRGRRLVVASPAAEASRLLQPLVPAAADILGSIQSVSLVVVNLGFRRADVTHPMEGYGFLVPQDEADFPLLGVLWADSIFPAHAPPDHRLVRVFLGGARDPSAVTRSENELLATAMSALGELLGLSGKPVLVDVCRYPAAIPQYECGHVEAIAQLHRSLAAHRRLYVIGNYLEGVSLNDCIRVATESANSINQTRGEHDAVERRAEDLRAKRRYRSTARAAGNSRRR
jgi:oxygen-dependent protoporphyrinogen oxidase